MIEFKDVTISFNGHEIISGFSLTVEKGEHAVLTGPSGCGKSSVLKALTGVVPLKKGKIAIDGMELNDRTVMENRKKICYIPQKITFDPSESVREFLLFPFSFRANKSLVPSSSEINEKFESAGLNIELLERQMSEMSGGQQQRVAVVRGLMLKREIYLLDEITSNLDAKNRKMIAEMFRNINDISILSVSHDEEWIRGIKKVIDLGAGEK